MEILKWLLAVIGIIYCFVVGYLDGLDAKHDNKHKE